MRRSGYRQEKSPEFHVNDPVVCFRNSRVGTVERVIHLNNRPSYFVRFPGGEVLQCSTSELDWSRGRAKGVA
jgi:hypothetical protein